MRELFLPETIGNKRIRPARILSLAINEQTIKGALVYVTSSSTAVEELISLNLPTHQDIDHQENISKLVASIRKKIDHIVVSVPSTLVIFKELTLPFSNYEKIAMTFEFEIEPLLPFTLQESISDFIITEAAQDSARIITCSIRSQDLKNMLQPFNQPNTDPDIITIDALALCTLYGYIPDYATIKELAVIIDIDYHLTRIMLIHNNNFRFIRHIQQGLNDLAIKVAQMWNISSEDVLQKITTSDETRAIDPMTIDRDLQDALMPLLNEIQFTLNSFCIKLDNEQAAIDKILILGHGARVHNIAILSEHILQIPCEIFNHQALFNNHTIKNKTKNPSCDITDHMTVIGAALPHRPTKQFNLRRKEFMKDNSSLVTRQIGTALFLCAFMIGSLVIRGYMQITELSEAAYSFEKKEIQKLQSIIPPDKTNKKTTLNNLVTRAEKSVKEQHNVWAPFTETYISPLQILEDVTRLIDKKLFDIKISSLSMTINNGSPSVELKGFFKSITGEDHYSYFSQFKKRFDGAQVLEVDGSFEERPKEALGIPFTVKLKPRINE